MSGALLLSPVERDDLTHAEALALTQEARAALRSALEWAQLAVDLVMRAWAMRADVALCYPSWKAYCAAEFSGLREVRIPKDTRAEIVEALSSAEMSTRKIGAVLQISDQTVRADLGGPDPEPVVRAPRARAIEVAPAPAAVAPERPLTQVVRVLAAITAAGPSGLTWIELGEALGLHHGSASAVLSKLDRRGLIERTINYRYASAAYIIRRGVLSTGPMKVLSESAAGPAL